MTVESCHLSISETNDQMNSKLDFLLSMEESNMGNCCSQSCKAQAIREGKEDTQVKFAIIIIANLVKIKGFVIKNSRYVVGIA